MPSISSLNFRLRVPNLTSLNYRGSVFTRIDCLGHPMLSIALSDKVPAECFNLDPGQDYKTQ